MGAGVDTGREKDGPAGAARPGTGSGPSGPAPGSTEGPAPVPEADQVAVGEWRGVPRELLRMRRLILALTLVPIAVAGGAVAGWLVGPPFAAVALLPLLLLLWIRHILARNWRSWKYAERDDDLLISRGVLWRRLTVVPYGRMQLVEVTSGPLERRYGLAGVQLHTAAATSDARIPGLAPDEAARLRDRLTELGEARSAGL
ncbi:hypothetical protein EYS09_26560 [Streptomyces kasugaensis]|uniref:YdbS-like PH domain-containing protein n=1 Tax=Streptomyces kasugaensis TaxID=1946 RepID=A0A4Q9HQG8_STRKA|nr:MULTISPECIES: PH domain-containing protein [Streptomyces]MYU53225.1 PH domain-containing protein [Streptomyces sp. SID7805]TBO56699.1 hypothetical protein EYS09_26560 [Streptomyces kasugaensis]WSK13315.1 PH domain-containing protein [Streptomyces celluloflavus]